MFKNLFQDMDPIFRPAVRLRTFRTFITDVERPQKRSLGIGVFQRLGISGCPVTSRSPFTRFAFWTISFRSRLDNPKPGWRYMFPGVILRGGYMINQGIIFTETVGNKYVFQQ